MMFSRAAEISSARSSSARDWRRWSFESGGERVGRVKKKEAPVRGIELGERFATGRMQEVRKAETDLLRWYCVCSCCLKTSSLL
jgi:hypothetical protein